MQFAHARYYDFLAFFVLLNNERWILPLESHKGLQEKIQLLILLRFDSQGHDWLGDVHRCHIQLCVQIAKSFS